MKRLFLIHGLPHQGKTFLASRLRAQFSCEYISVDRAYLKFIRERCPELDFKLLEKYIGVHYDHILLPEQYSVAVCGRNFVSEWRSYLLKVISRAVRRPRDVVVEGYLLRDCKERICGRFEKERRVILLEVAKRQYFLAGTRLELEDLAKLGDNDALSLPMRYQEKSRHQKMAALWSRNSGC
jgi:hypothetical protein